MVDHSGAVVDGDELLYIIARSRHQNNMLKPPVVGTLMSNLGLELALKKLGIDFIRAQVGDRYVLELLQKHGGTLGGESSGHVLCLDRTSTGDGIVTALQVLASCVTSGRTLSELRRGVRKYPQCLLNVPLKHKRDITHLSAVQAEIHAIEKRTRRQRARIT
jgi:phosphoglucosamine mutase